METKKFKTQKFSYGIANRKNVIIILLSVFLFAAGIFAIQQNRENSKLISEYRTERNASEEYLKQTFETIESNLAEIRMHEGLIQGNLENQEVNGSTAPEDKILQEIKMIETIMEKNRALIAELNLKVDSQNADLVKYKKTINQANKRFDSLKEEVSNLMAINTGLQNDLNLAKENTTGLENELQAKFKEIQSNSKTINEQLVELQKRDSTMNTVFYTVGSYKELSEEKLVEKDGGILGIGATKVLAGSLDRSKFIKVDKRNLSEIPIMGKRAELVTKHDITSYEIVMNKDRAEMLKITDPQLFWRDSKYLVILVKNQDEDLAELN